MSSILCVAVIKIEPKMFKSGRVVEVKINPWTNGVDFILLKLLQIMSEIVTTDPYLTQLPVSF